MSIKLIMVKVEVKGRLNRVEYAIVKTDNLEELDKKLKEIYIGDFNYSVINRFENIVDRDDVFVERYHLI